MRYLILLALSGCAMAPTSVPISMTHVSHLTQHEPFTERPTNYGMDYVSVGLKWTRGPFTAQVSEGLILEAYSPAIGGYGAFVGPREVFTGQITYEIPLQ